jgi:hypothetical protein
MAILNPAPGAPSIREAETQHPSKRSLAGGWGAMTSILSAISIPGSSASTTKADNPRAPGAPPVRANTT